MLNFLINKITSRWKGNRRTSVGILGGILGLLSNLLLFLAKFFIGSLSGSVGFYENKIWRTESGESVRMTHFHERSISKLMQKIIKDKEKANI